MMPNKPLSILLFSSLFPNSVEKTAGLFIRERMFRVAKHTPLFVISPKPWSPFDFIIRFFKADYRLSPTEQEIDQGVTVHFPRFLAIPYLFRSLDGYFMAKAAEGYIKKHCLEQAFDHIDAHFSYPDGYAAAILKQALSKTLTITMRGTELPHSRDRKKCEAMKYAWQMADKVICVSSSLKQIALDLGAEKDKFEVVGNGVDLEKFSPKEAEIREKLNISSTAKVLITVGGLVPRKGFHRVINQLPKLLYNDQDIHYLVIGGATKEGNYESDLRELVDKLKLHKQVHFLGVKSPAELAPYLSTSNLFLLMSENEGWANVLLESMACGTPILASNVGGNAEVVCHEKLGKIIELNDEEALFNSINAMLNTDWDSEFIIRYAHENSWNSRIQRLIEIFNEMKRN